jgi:hypothetical protein
MGRLASLAKGSRGKEGVSARRRGRRRRGRGVEGTKHLPFTSLRHIQDEGMTPRRGMHRVDRRAPRTWRVKAQNEMPKAGTRAHCRQLHDTDRHPAADENAEDFARALHALVVESSAPNGETLETECGRGEAYHASRIPGVTVRDYVVRLAECLYLGSGIFPVAFVMIGRLVAALDVSLTPSSVHRLILAALCLARKYLEDEELTPSYVARCVGVSVEELNLLERRTLRALEYRCHVREAEYARALRSMKSIGETRWGARRSAVTGAS